MVTALRAFRATTRDTTRRLFGRFYGAAACRPVVKGFHTQMNAYGRTPRLDTVMSGNRMQPHIHDAVVAVTHRGVVTQFHFFVKNHCRLRTNRIIERWTNIAWKGDIVVMRKGIVHEVVSLRGRDATLADFAVKRFVEVVRQRRRFSIPKNLAFHKQ